MFGVVLYAKCVSIIGECFIATESAGSPDNDLHMKEVNIISEHCISFQSVVKTATYVLSV